MDTAAQHNFRPRIVNPKLEPCSSCGSLEFEIGPVWEWLLGWFSFTDAEGVEHSHDPNQRSRELRCRKCGNQSKQVWFEPCPACGKVRGASTKDR